MSTVKLQPHRFPGTGTRQFSEIASLTDPHSLEKLYIDAHTARVLSFFHVFPAPHAGIGFEAGCQAAACFRGQTDVGLLKCSMRCG